VTLVVPFADSSQVDGLLDRLSKLLASFSPFETALAETARFRGLLYLNPEPREPFIEITEALAEAFPEFPPYGGEFDEVVPHVTVAQADGQVLAAASESLPRSCR
jgi:2'-5' RNA ligase